MTNQHTTNSTLQNGSLFTTSEKIPKWKLKALAKKTNMKLCQQERQKNEEQRKRLFALFTILMVCSNEAITFCNKMPKSASTNKAPAKKSPLNDNNKTLTPEECKNFNTRDHDFCVDKPNGLKHCYSVSENTKVSSVLINPETNRCLKGGFSLDEYKKNINIDKTISPEWRDGGFFDDTVLEITAKHVKKNPLPSSSTQDESNTVDLKKLQQEFNKALGLNEEYQLNLVEDSGAGAITYAKKSIDISPSLKPLDQMLTLGHELAHQRQYQNKFFDHAKNKVTDLIAKVTTTNGTQAPTDNELRDTILGLNFEINSDIISLLMNSINYKKVFESTYSFWHSSDNDQMDEMNFFNEAAKKDGLCKPANRYCLSYHPTRTIRQSYMAELHEKQKALLQEFEQNEIKLT